MTVRTLSRNVRVYVAGQEGRVGAALRRHFEAAGFTEFASAPSGELDLRDRSAVEAFFDAERPEVVVLPPIPGGLAGASRPADALETILRIHVNVLEAAHRVGVRRLLLLASSSVYPTFAAQPTPERALLGGAPDATDEARAIAEIAGIAQVRAMRRQHGHEWISAVVTNVYGPVEEAADAGPADGDVVGRTIRAFQSARTGEPVRLPGTGALRRELLHVDDLAAACLYLLERYDGDEHVNVGTGTDLTTGEVAALVAKVAGYDGRVEWDVTKPDHPARKLLDVTRLLELGWRPSIPLDQGIAGVYASYSVPEVDLTDTMTSLRPSACLA